MIYRKKILLIIQASKYQALQKKCLIFSKTSDLDYFSKEFGMYLSNKNLDLVYFFNLIVSRRDDEDNKRFFKGETNRSSPGGPVHA